GLPSKATCAFNPPTVTPGTLPSGTTIQLMFGTSSSETPGSPRNRNVWPLGTMGMLVGLAIMFALTELQRRYAPRLRFALGVCGLAVALATIMIGCGGGSSTSSTPAYTGTAKGTSTFTVTGTATGATTMSTSVTVTVN